MSDENKYLTVGKLKEWLSKIPDDVLVMNEYDGGYNIYREGDGSGFKIKTFKKQPPMVMVWSDYEEDEKGDIKGIVI
jgi:hypothetical protein